MRPHLLHLTTIMFLSASMGCASSAKKQDRDVLDAKDLRLFEAVRAGKMDEFNAALANGANVKARGVNGFSALHYAAARRTGTAMLGILLDRGAEVDALSVFGGSALLDACTEAQAENAEVLLKRGASARSVTPHGSTLLMAVAWKTGLESARAKVMKFKVGKDGKAVVEPEYNPDPEKARIAEMLLKAGADPNVKDRRGFSALHHAAQLNRPLVVKALLRGKANPNQGNQYGITPLHTAAAHGFAAVTLALMKGGAKPGARASDGTEPLSFGAENGHADVVEVLLKGGANPNYGVNKLWPLIPACKNGHTKVVEALLGGGANPNAKHSGGWSPAAVAAEEGHVGVLSALVKNRADLNATVPDGRTPLMIAVQFKKAEAAKVLIAGKAKVNVVEPKGGYALLFAVQQGQTAMVRMLLAAGAVTSINTGGDSLIEVARSVGNKEIVELIEKK